MLSAQIKEEYPNLLKKFLNKLDEDERKVYEERLQILNVKHTDSEQAEADKKVYKLYIDIIWIVYLLGRFSLPVFFGTFL